MRPPGGGSATIRDALHNATGVLQTAGIETPHREARLLLAHLLGITPAALLLEPDLPVDVSAYAGLLKRRAAHEPLAYIVGHREFWSLDLAVSPATLIPRADSETVIEVALAMFAGHEPPKWILDLGTGTGCLLLAALSEFPAAFGIGVDRSPAAARLAADNAAALGLRSRAAFLCGDWDAALAARFDMILTNPPYIATGELAGLMPDVVDYEPRLALDGGADGLTAYRRVIPALSGVLAPGGIAVMEVGQGQGEAVSVLARSAGYIVSLREDLSGIVRALALRRPLP